MFQHVDDFGKAPRCIAETSGKEPGDVPPEVTKCQPHEDQCQQEVGCRQTHKPQRRKGIVANRVLVGGGVDTDGYRDGVHQNNGDKGNRRREGDALPDQFAYRLLPVERAAEVTFEHVSEPTEVLNDQRSVQPVTGADQRLLFRIHHRIGTCRPHAVDDKIRVVPLRELDDGEHGR